MKRNSVRFQIQREKGWQIKIEKNIYKKRKNYGTGREKYGYESEKKRDKNVGEIKSAICSSKVRVVMFRWQQDENDKEARKDIGEKSGWGHQGCYSMNKKYKKRVKRR